MKSFVRSLIRFEAALHPLLTVALVVGLNVAWAWVLQLFDLHFRAVAGLPLLDLQNVQRILSAPEALALISGYSAEARTLYWIFFLLDNVIPWLCFGAFALLWVAVLRRAQPTFFAWVQRTPLLLIPFGVGFFDTIENLAFLAAIQQATAPIALTALQIGLVFVWLKAICLFATFGLTLALLIGVPIAALWRRFAGKPMTT